MVVPGTPRDSLSILDTLLNLDGGKPEMGATDNASHAGMVLGIFRLLGSRFSPRFADLPDQRLWRADLPDGPASDYGRLEAIASTAVIMRPDIELQRIGRLPVREIMQRLQHQHRPDQVSRQ